MHFFHPVQQSARHLYHSALPLSPKSSTFFPKKYIQEKTLVTGVAGTPSGWGVVIRTIKANSGNFTRVTTFSHRIAAACDNGTVCVYDSVTGALRLSLSPTDPVREIRGTPDGSLLFCAHEGPLVTIWDIQTGGLIHTFVLECKAEDIAISLGGCYLSCRLSDGSVKIWEVESKLEGPVVLGGSPVAGLCWVEPEQYLTVAGGTSVFVWDAAVGRVVRRFLIQDSIRGMVYSEKLRRMAILTTSGAESAITIIYPSTGISFTRWSPPQLSCFAPFQTSTQFVFGMEIPGLMLFDPLAQCWKRSTHPATITSISTSSNGTTAANAVGSGIQLLSLLGVGWRSFGVDEPTADPVGVLTIRAADEGRIITVHMPTRDRIEFWESGSNIIPGLFTLTWNAHEIPTDFLTIICASLQFKTAICGFRKMGREYMGSWQFGGGHSWSVAINEQPSAGSFSPTGTRFVTFHNTHDSVHIYMWETLRGQLQAHLHADQFNQSWLTTDFPIKFEKSDEFCSQHETYRTLYAIYAVNTRAPTHTGGRPPFTQWIH